jgi:hypothetical protein
VKNDNFDQLPNLTESFDQVKRSSEIRSSEQLPAIFIRYLLNFLLNIKVRVTVIQRLTV